MDVIFHADDFGITPEQSERILSCCPGGAGDGVLNSLSILANSPRFEECASLLDGRPKGLHVGVHLNFVEGHCCADPAKLPLLVDGEGMFNQSYAGLMKLSFGMAHDELLGQLALEATAQIERVLGRFPELMGHLRLDGHQHTQLIPAAFRAIIQVLKEHEDWHLEYLRIPAEPTGAFTGSDVAGGIKPVNWAKHLLLKWLWATDEPALDVSGLGRYEDVSALFCGVLFSGRMDEHRVEAVWPRLMECAERGGTSLELLFHPGRVQRAEDCLNPALKGFVRFSCGDGRDVERDALCSDVLRRIAAEAGAEAWAGDKEEDPCSQPIA